MEKALLEEYRKRIYGYIEENVDTVLKKPVGFIHYPFIDPGSVYDGNVWDWDTFWSVYGLLNLAKKLKGGALEDKIIEHAKGNVRNFMDQDRKSVVRKECRLQCRSRWSPYH